MAVFTWSADDPPVHARYRMEWKFRSAPKTKEDRTSLSASERMSAIGVVQEGDEILTTPTRPFELPAEAEDARRVIAQLVSTMERVSQVHTFAKGIGLAAPQIGVGRAAALVRSPGGDSVTLLNPRIIDESAETDEQYEGCLSLSSPDHSRGSLAAAECPQDRGDSGILASGYDCGPAGGRVPGVSTGPRGSLHRSQGQVRAGQLVSGSAQIRCQARVIASVQGQFAANFQRRRRPPRTRRAAACRMR